MSPADLPAPIRTAILSRMPDADFSEVKLIGRGIGSTAYRFAGPDGAWVVRVSNDYPEPWTWRGGRRFEAPLLRHLECLGLPVVHSAFDLPGDGALPVAIVEREVVGVPGPEVPADELAQFLTALHEIPIDTARGFGVREGRTLDELRGTYQAASLDGATHLRMGAALTELERSQPPRTLIHADFRPAHWYVDGGLTAVIDFGDAIIDDPALDFARIPSELFDAVLHHYPADADFEQRARLFKVLHPLMELPD
ncbi:aminoglycoside phosphotransferase family protein [Kribbella pittospori]|uniref:Aminoglycoside phosphotransferase family protein n=1 Tax=Kribbella pittospori TaxID=722689 RepID=A0A4R0KQD9_9ACTN|nr:aminoglycoside phosphotransferase family protein [Kribbella pittospori]TCC61196.1 aminoglycoside phosphotransferase family protein [Kribbella pittospori]